MGLGLGLGLGLVVSACGDVPADDSQADRLPWASTSVPPIPVPTDNPMTAEKMELGRLLFHDPILSSDGTVACLTCHSPVWGMSDGLPVSVGIGGEGPIGTGRTGPNRTRRNSQTLWNAGYRAELFTDGRALSLEDQVSFPLDDPAELGRSLDDVAADLAANPEYVALFAAAFPEGADRIRPETIRQAIATFERTLVSDNAPYDQFARGDDAAMGDAEVRGLFLFAEIGCADCHAPPLFESGAYELGAIGDDNDGDRGRAEVTGEPTHRDRYRVPTLRNIRETQPYFHDGSVATLSEAVVVELAVRGVRPLTDGEGADLEAFLSDSLMDKSRSPLRPTAVPSGLPVPLDGYRIPR